MKFINKSKAEAVRKRSMKLDVQPVVDTIDSDEEHDMLDDKDRRGNNDKTSDSKVQNTTSVVLMNKKTETNSHSHHNKKLQMLEKRDSFSKLMDSFGRIL